MTGWSNLCRYIFLQKILLVLILFESQRKLRQIFIVHAILYHLLVIKVAISLKINKGPPSALKPSEQ